MTSREAFAGLRALLREAGVPDPAFDAAVLLELAVGRQWRWRDAPLTPEEEALLAELGRRRAAREPLQYLAGRWPFLDFELEVGPGVLVPRADTELLCETGASLVKGIARPRVLDLCAGTGCVGLGLKSLVPAAQVICLEKSPQAFCYLQKNAAGALPGSGKKAPAVRAVLGDVFGFEKKLAPASLDLILANPPYVTGAEMEQLAPELAFEPRQALYAPEEGLAFYRHIAPGYFFALRPGGWLALEIGWRQGQAVCALLRAAGCQKVECRADLSGNDRVVLGQKPEKDL